MPPTATTGPRTVSAAGVPPRAHLEELCTGARRLARRRCRAEAAARRLRGHHAPRRAARLAACSDQLLIAFHRTLDRIWAADGFDEALAIFRDYRAALAEAMAGAAVPPRAGEPTAGPHIPAPQPVPR